MAKALLLGETFPDAVVQTTHGELRLHEFFGDSPVVFFSHPRDFTPVCTTELGSSAKIFPELQKRGVKMIGLSVDPVDSHKAWIKDVISSQGLEGEDLPFPIIADDKRELAIRLGMLDPVEKDSTGMPVTCRSVFIIGADKKLKLSILYPATTGRNFDEILRVVDSLQLTADYSLATPSGWKPGEKVIVAPSISDEDAKTKFPKGVETVPVPSGKTYLRYTPDPLRESS